MSDGDLVERVERLNIVLPQIIRRMHRIPTESRPAPSLSLPQFRMMLLLEMEGPSTMGALARLASVTMPTATSSVNALVGGRYVTRHRAGHDRRVVVVSLTEKGRRVLASLHQQRRERIRVLLSRLDVADQQRLVEAFEAILDVVSKLDEDDGLEPDAGRPSRRS